MEEAIKTLEKYNFLQECILKDIKWRDHCTNVDLVFNNIWSSEGQLRADLDQERLLVLRFHSVQEFHFIEDLNEENLLHPELINWGLNEISILEINEDDALLKKYNNLRSKLNHVSIVWERDRKIDLVFRQLKIMHQL